MEFIIYFKYAKKPDWQVPTKAEYIDQALEIAREYMEFAEANFTDSPEGFEIYQFVHCSYYEQF